MEYEETGFVTFKFNGKAHRVKTAFGGSLIPGFRRPVIGDRCGSTYSPFEGKIYSVKLFSKPLPVSPKTSPGKKVSVKKAARSAPRKKPSLSVNAGFSRAAFFRDEKDAVVKAHIFNTFPQTAFVSRITVDLQGTEQQKPSHAALKIAPGKYGVFPVKVNTNLMVGEYKCNVSFTARIGKMQEKQYKMSFPIYICPKDFERFPIYTEAVYQKAVENLEYLGMNERYPAPLGVFLDKTYANAVNNYMTNYIRNFDNMLYRGFRYRGLFRLMNERWSKIYPRTNRNGKKLASTEVSNPELIKLVEKCAEQGSVFLNHPAVVDINLNEEMRDLTAPSFSGHEQKAFKAFSGMDIPGNVMRKTSPVNYKTAREFPANRVISEKDPLYTYYQWFWRGGDGWPGLDGKIASIFKKNFKTPIAARYEPANRMPPVWYLSPEIDIVGNWAYLTPEPLNSYAMASELNAFAAQNKHKDMGILGHITLLMYRGASAPRGQKVTPEPAWVKKFPRANYITVAPDLVQEALYLQFARKISGLSFHGYNAIYDSTIGWGYICSNHDTKYAMRDFFLNVAQKLGLLAKHLPERKVEVAALHSFASFVYAQRGSWGHQSWMFDSNLAMMRGNLMPGVIFEDQILRDGFGDLKVLVLTYCDVLPANVAQKIRDFQAKGGIVVGDPFTTPAIMPDLMIRPVERTQDPVKDKKALQEAGLGLRKALQGLYEPYTAASNADLLTHVRSHNEADYLFVVNDKRTFGNYVGQYGLLQEKGMPNSGTVTIRRNAGVVYDMIRGKEVPFTSAKGSTTIRVDFSTNDGRIFLLLPEKIGAVKADFPAKLKRGGCADLVSSLYGSSGRKIMAMHPMQILVTMPDGRKTDESTYGLFKDGVFTRKISIAGNAPAGIWKITVRELASGAEKSLTFLVQ